MDHWDMLNEIDQHGEGLTKWEVAFVEDLLQSDDMDGIPLSEAQEEKIEQLYEERL